MHEYYDNKINNDTQIDKYLNNYQKKDKSMTSELENYLPIIQKQKLCTKYLQNKRVLDSGKSSD